MPSLRRGIAELFWRTWGIALSSTLLTLLIFFAQYGQTLLALLDSRTALPTGSSQLLLTEQIHRLLRPLDRLPFADAVSLTLFWAIVGFGVYLLYAMIAELVDATRDQVEVDRIQTRTNLLRALLIHFGEKIAAAAALVATIVLLYAGLANYWLSLVDLYVTSRGTENVGYLLAGLAGLNATLYVALTSAYIVWIYERRRI